MGWLIGGIVYLRIVRECFSNIVCGCYGVFFISSYWNVIWIFVLWFKFEWFFIKEVCYIVIIGSVIEILYVIFFLFVYV